MRYAQEHPNDYEERFEMMRVGADLVREQAWEYDLKNFSLTSDYTRDGTPMCGRCNWAKVVCRCVGQE